MGPAIRTAAERFETKIAATPDGCWAWRGAMMKNGYGRFFSPVGNDTHRVVLAHRWSYEYHVAPIPDGLQIDHLCRNRWCVNPYHLEPVTNAVNSRRAQSLTHCKSGLHEFTEANTIREATGRRSCRECARARWRRKRRT